MCILLKLHYAKFDVSRCFVQKEGLKGLYFESYQAEFSDCRCDVVCILYNDNFPQRGAAKIKYKQI